MGFVKFVQGIGDFEGASENYVARLLGVALVVDKLKFLPLSTSELRFQRSFFLHVVMLLK